MHGRGQQYGASRSALAALRAQGELRLVAGEAIGGHRGIYVADDGLAYIAAPSSTNAQRLIGVTPGAVAMGASFDLKIDGVLEEPSWTWAGSAPVWLGAAGVLTQTPPASGYLVQVGIPMGPTSLKVEPRLVALV